METPIKVKELKELLLKTTGYIDEAKGGEEIRSMFPWCETNKYGRNKDGHFYVNTYTLRTNCFHANCKEARGNIFGLFKKLGVNPKEYIIGRGG